MTPPPETRTPKTRTPEILAPEIRAPEMQVPDIRMTFPAVRRVTHSQVAARLMLVMALALIMATPWLSGGVTANAAETTTDTTSNADNATAESFEAGSFEAGMEAYQAGDYETAIEILTPLADAGDSRAQYIVGISILNGLRPISDQARATAYLVRSAKQEHLEANLVLGSRYLEGEGVTQNAQFAERYLKTAARLGSIEAQFVLGYAFLYGGYKDFPKSFQTAAAFFDLAARQQHEASQFFLSTLLFKSDDPNIFDPSRGLMWTIILASEKSGRFSKQSNNNLDLLKRQMRRDEFEALYVKSSLLARRCIDSGYEDCG